MLESKIPVISIRLAAYLALIVWMTIEMWAMRGWARWAFHGIPVFRRKVHLGGMGVAGLQISRLVSATLDLEERRLPVRELSSDLYLVKISSASEESQKNDEFLSPLTGTITLNRETATLCFTARLSVGISILGVSFLIGEVMPLLIEGRIAESVLLCLFFIVIGPVACCLAYRGRLTRYWSLLLINLNRLRAK
jgi:hypothetical protein